MATVRASTIGLRPGRCEPRRQPSPQRCAHGALTDPVLSLTIPVMTRRNRRLAGLATLLGLSFMLAEGFAAGTCTPGSTPMAAMNAMGSGTDSGEHASADATACDQLHTGGRAHDGPACPFAGFFANGCSVTASVAATGPCLLAFAPRVAGLSTRGPTATPLLLATPLFRPPRA